MDDDDCSYGALMGRGDGGRRHGGTDDPDADGCGEGNAQGLHANSIGI
jgi:hypothetical protein